jgi:hypothetical protein
VLTWITWKGLEGKGEWEKPILSPQPFPPAFEPKNIGLDFVSLPQKGVLRAS